MTKLSVVMPVYNQEKHVAQAINNILDQTFTDFEFIIVDDGSTDKTLSVVKSFKDKRIVLLEENHSGFLQTLKKGVSFAQGKWIARMDSDDICHPERLEKQLVFLQKHPDCCFVTTKYGILTPNNCYLKPNVTEGWQYLTSEDITFAKQLFCDPSTVFDREKAIEVGYDDAWENEKPLWYKLLRVGTGVLLEEPLYYVRWILGSHSRSQSELRNHTNHGIRAKYNPESFQNQQPKSSDPDEKNISLAKKCIKYYLAADDFAAAKGVAAQLIKNHPLNIDAWKLLIRTTVKRNADIKANVKNSKFSFLKVDSPW